MTLQEWADAVGATIRPQSSQTVRVTRVMGTQPPKLSDYIKIGQDKHEYWYVRRMNPLPEQKPEGETPA